MGTSVEFVFLFMTSGTSCRRFIVLMMGTFLFEAVSTFSPENIGSPSETLTWFGNIVNSLAPSEIFETLHFFNRILSSSVGSKSSVGLCSLVGSSIVYSSLVGRAIFASTFLSLVGLLLELSMVGF